MSHYLDKLSGTDGRKGPTSLMKKTLEDFGTHRPTTVCWVTHLGTIYIDDEPEAHNKVARIVVERLWQGYAAEGSLLQGISKTCKDEETMTDLRKQIRSPQDRAMLENLHTTEPTSSGDTHTSAPNVVMINRTGFILLTDARKPDAPTASRKYLAVYDIPISFQTAGFRWRAAHKCDKMTFGKKVNWIPKRSTSWPPTEAAKRAQLADGQGGASTMGATTPPMRRDRCADRTRPHQAQKR